MKPIVLLHLAKRTLSLPILELLLTLAIVWIRQLESLLHLLMDTISSPFKDYLVAFYNLMLWLSWMGIESQVAIIILLEGRWVVNKLFTEICNTQNYVTRTKLGIATQIQFYCIWQKVMKSGFKMKSTRNSIIHRIFLMIQEDTPILLGTLFLFEYLPDQLVDHHFIYLLFSQKWCCFMINCLFTLLFFH